MPGHFYNALFVVGVVCHIVGKGFDIFWCISHSDARPCITQHADIVVTVATANDVCRRNAQEMEEFLQAKGFVDATRRHFQAQRFRMIDFSPPQIKLGQKGIKRLEQVRRPS